MGRKNRLFIIVFILVAMVGFGIYLDRIANQNRRTKSIPRIVSARGELANYEMSTISIFNNAAPSVVYLFTENAVSGFFGRQEVRQGAGSGFLWDLKILPVIRPCLKMDLIPMLNPKLDNITPNGVVEDCGGFLSATLQLDMDKLKKF